MHNGSAKVIIAKALQIRGALLQDIGNFIRQKSKRLAIDYMGHV
jgi:hypothetical protein